MAYEGDTLTDIIRQVFDRTHLALEVLDVSGTIADGRKTVTAAGTAVALGTSTAFKWLVVQALVGNTGSIAVGASTVVAASGTERGVSLGPLATVTFKNGNLANIYIDSTVNGEGVSILYAT